MYKGELGKFDEMINFLEERYNFRGPMHFTDYTNLGKIMSEGYLYSREACNTKGIEFKDVADQDVIKKSQVAVKSCVRFYYKEKTPTLYRNEGIKKCDENEPHIPIPVYLIFSNELIKLESTLFADGNAGSDYTYYGNTYKFFNNMSWNYIMSRGAITTDDYREKYEIIRCRNAELLSEDSVPLKYLKKIVFRSNADKVRAINDFGYNELYEVNKDMFNNMNNYLEDYSVYKDKNELEVKLKFNNYLSIDDVKTMFSLYIIDKDDNYVNGTYNFNIYGTTLKISMKYNNFNTQYMYWKQIRLCLHNIEICKIELNTIEELNKIVYTREVEILENEDKNILSYPYNIKNIDAIGYEKKFEIIDKESQVKNVYRSTVLDSQIGKNYIYTYKYTNIEDIIDKTFEFSLNNIVLTRKNIYQMETAK